MKTIMLAIGLALAATAAHADTWKCGRTYQDHRCHVMHKHDGKVKTVATPKTPQPVPSTGTSTPPPVASVPTPAPTPKPSPTPATPPPVATAPAATPAGCQRPYSVASIWNTPIAANTTYSSQSDYNITALRGTFGSDPNQYTMPVYEVDNSTPLVKVNLSGSFSDVTDNGAKLTKTKGLMQIPIPATAQAATGGDSQIIIWNRETGDEWGFWKAAPSADGSWTVTNGYHYNTHWSGVPPKSFGSRGAGVPYLTGLIRRCEIEQGRIEHAIAFAYDVPTSQFVYPATKSDGTGAGPDMPEGAQLQLDPTLTDQQIEAWGCKAACLVIAHALQDYGMIIIDKAGHPKIYAEYEGTAHWNGVIVAKTVSTIPYSAFKVLPYHP